METFNGEPQKVVPKKNEQGEQDATELAEWQSYEDQRYKGVRFEIRRLCENGEWDKAS